MACIAVEFPVFSRAHIQETTDKLLFLWCTSRNMGFTMCSRTILFVSLLLPEIVCFLLQDSWGTRKKREKEVALQALRPERWDFPAVCLLWRLSVIQAGC